MTPFQGKRKALFLSALLLVGCAHPTKRFPIGLYDVPSDEFPTVAAAGFNTVVAGASKPTLDAARTNNIDVIGSVSVLDRERIRSVRAHPALWGWYLFDEPDLHVVSPHDVAQLNARLHALSHKPTMIVLMSGSAVEKYRGTADLIGLDWYPVPWAPVATLSREMRLARLGMRDRPFYAVLQAFDWSSDSGLLRTETPLRPPTREEMRCMTYLALTQGASGLLYYTYASDRWKIREHPEIWDALTELVKEVQKNAPIFAQRVDWWPAETRVHGAPGEMYNEIMEARVSLSLYRVAKTTDEILPGFYLVAVNTSAKAADLSFKFPFTGTHAIATSCNTTDLVVEEGWVRKQFAPFEVCIFGPIAGELAQ